MSAMAEVESMSASADHCVTSYCQTLDQWSGVKGRWNETLTKEWNIEEYTIPVLLRDIGHDFR